MLNNKTQVKIMEDKHNSVQFQGLSEKPTTSAEDLIKTMELGFSLRTTQTTVNNDESSRSHAICQLIVRDDQNARKGRLILVDLAVGFGK